MSPTAPSTKRTSLLTLGSAAVIAVYAAGYIRTRSAADALASETAGQSTAHASPVVAELKSPGEVTDSIAVAVITAAATSTRKVLTTRPSARKPATRKVTTAKRRKSTAVVASTPARSVPMRAPSLPAPVATTPTPRPIQSQRGQFRDGVYRGYGTSRHGDIEAEVEINGGKIGAARITQCLTRYPCSRISQLPDEVVARQTANVDYVSGATQSSDAFIQAVTDALSKAR
jgi:uncharacterized protein with FMN-binding domain